MVERAVIDQYIDPQREKLYAWEDTFLLSRRRVFSSIAGSRSWIKWACGQYGVKIPTVVEQPANRDFSCYRSDRHRIQIRKSHWNPWVCLHEAAHAICEAKWGILGHGPKFLSVLIWLLKESGVAPQAALTASAKAAKLKFTQVSRAAPSQSKQSKRKAKQYKRK